jgi:arginase family enzyme
VLRHVKPGGRYYIVFDCDGMDPAVMPAPARQCCGLDIRLDADIVHA